jgi:hypothetical protein
LTVDDASAARRGGINRAGVHAGGINRGAINRVGINRGRIAYRGAWAGNRVGWGGVAARRAWVGNRVGWNGNYWNRPRWGAAAAGLAVGATAAAAARSAYYYGDGYGYGPGVFAGGAYQPSAMYQGSAWEGTVDSAYYPSYPTRDIYARGYVPSSYYGPVCDPRSDGRCQ